MKLERISRRRFIKATGTIVGAGAAAYAGLSFLYPHVPVDINYPEESYGDKTMQKRILVAYSSRTGSTAGIAEAIGKTLAKDGSAVDVLQMKNVKDLAVYSAIVAGSAIQGSKWLPEAMEFLKINRKALNLKPFAAFLGCMTLAMPKADKYRQHVADFMKPVREIVRPVSEGLFAGSLEISKIPSLGDRLKFKLSVFMGVWTEGDHRDWKQIETWAMDLKPKLQV